MVRVRFFAGFREKVNSEAVEIQVAAQTSLEDFLKKLGNDYPEIGEIIAGNKATIAVNHEVVGPEHIIKEDDEVALFPPVSGG